MEKEPQPQLRAVIYIRVNHGAVGDPEAAAEHVERQRQACEQYAADAGYRIIGEYLDTGGGVRFERRPTLRRLLEDVEVGGVEAVITSDLARLTRHAPDAAALVDRLEQAGVRLVSRVVPDTGLDQQLPQLAAQAPQTDQNGCILPGPEPQEAAEQ